MNDSKPIVTISAAAAAAVCELKAKILALTPPSSYGYIERGIDILATCSLDIAAAKPYLTSKEFDDFKKLEGLLVSTMTEFLETPARKLLHQLQRQLNRFARHDVQLVFGDDEAAHALDLTIDDFKNQLEGIES